jgi:hypothetical protein
MTRAGEETMKRDMKLCGQILTVVEKQPTISLTAVGIEGRNTDEIDFHVMLLKEAGFVDAEQVGSSAGEPMWQVRRLTWAGCEFLERERATERRNTAGGTRA